MSNENAETVARQAAGEAAAALAAGAAPNGATSPGVVPTTPAESPAADAPNLTDLPKALREAALKLPAEAQAAVLDTYRRDIQPYLTRESTALAEERKKFEARLRNAEVAERIFQSEDPEARRLLYEAAERAAGRKPSNGNGNGQAAETEDEALSLYEKALAAADPKEFARQVRDANVALFQRLRAEEQTAEARADAEAYNAIQSEGQRIRNGYGDLLSDDEFKAAWDKAAAKAASDFRPGNVGVALAPYLREVIQTKLAKPSTAVRGRPASVPGGAEFAQPVDVPPWVREKRKPTGREIVESALKPLGATVEGLREMQFSGGTRLIPPS